MEWAVEWGYLCPTQQYYINGVPSQVSILILMVIAWNLLKLVDKND